MKKFLPLIFMLAITQTVESAAGWLWESGRQGPAREGMGERAGVTDIGGGGPSMSVRDALQDYTAQLYVKLRNVTAELAHVQAAIIASRKDSSKDLFRPKTPERCISAEADRPSGPPSRCATPDDGGATRYALRSLSTASVGE